MISSAGQCSPFARQPGANLLPEVENRLLFAAHRDQVWSRLVRWAFVRQTGAFTPREPAMFQIRRRQFLQQSAVIASGYFVSGLAAQESKSPNEKLNLAIVGTANKGWHNVQNLTSQNMVALCDVDANYLAHAAMSFPLATQYRDYRKLLDKEAGRIDAVVVSTADHMHAPVTSAALDLSKHVYCEKPLTHTVKEARTVAALAKKKKLATQMGTQIHADDNYRRVVELVQSGTIGRVTLVHNWCNKGWSGGKFEPWDKPAPAHLD